MEIRKTPQMRGHPPAGFDIQHGERVSPQAEAMMVMVARFKERVGWVSDVGTIIFAKRCPTEVGL
jgi:hypothetical protein